MASDISADSQVDWKFVSEREGGIRRKGYIPLSHKYQGKRTYEGDSEPTIELIRLIRDNSGVTVSAGFDIGRHSVTELRRLGLPTALTEKLAVFCDLPTAKAAAKLYETGGVEVSDHEAWLIFVAVQKTKQPTVEKHFDRLAQLSPVAKLKSYRLLPSKIQTALASFAWQKGQNWQKAVGSLNTLSYFIIHQDWVKAAEFLESMPDDKARRKLEANLIRDSLGEVNIKEQAAEWIRRHNESSFGKKRGPLGLD